VGGFGPWATVLGFSVAGTNGDGWFLIGGGVLAGGLLLWRGPAQRWPLVVAMLVAAIGALVAILDISNVSGIAEGSFLEDAVSPGWGLYVSLLASLSLGAAAGTTLVLRQRAPQRERDLVATTAPPPDG
jgi:hypothetical protein